MSQWVIYALVLVTAFFWGANFVLANFVLAELSPSLAAAIRFSIAGVVLLGIAGWQRANLWHLWRNHYPIYLGLGVVGITGFNLLFFFAMQYTSANNAALIMATNPLMTSLLALLWLKEPMTRTMPLALGIALLGVVIVISHGDLDALLAWQVNLGDGLMLLANLCWALYNLMGRKWLPTSSQATPLANTALILSAGAIVLSFIALVDPYQMIPQSITATALWALFVMIIGGTILAYIFWNIGLAQLGAGRTAVFMNIVPVFAFICAMGVGEFPTIAQWLGGLVVLTGLLVSVRRT